MPGFTLKTNQLDPLNTPLLRTWRHSQTAVYSPTAATVAKFTVTGGDILVHRLQGKIVTTLETTASNVSVTITGVGTSSTVASTVDATAAAAGDYLQVEGDGTAVIKGGATSKYFVTAGFPNPFIVPAGCVVNIVHAAAMTGTLRWDMWWEPLDENATVTSA